jgi:hypothetical protein
MSIIFRLINADSKGFKMPDYSTNWDQTPTTCKTAKVVRHKPVRNARVVYLAKAFIRGSTVSGHFKLAEGATVKTYAGKRRIEVECLWFGCKPPTTWMNITILSNPVFKDRYGEDVVWNIAK